MPFMELLSDPNVWVAFATLTVMEIVLGIDNIVFISVLVSRLPREKADQARRLGIALALIFRILLLLVISWVIGLTQPAIAAFGISFSWKDLILIAGGAFLVYKATHEMHAAIEEPHEAEMQAKASDAFAAIIAQIIVIDMVFSVDSIITAVGMAEHVEVMIAAVIVAVGVMFVASGPVAKFVADHPTTKMLALAFLLLIGTTLVIDGFAGNTGFHVEKGYIYAAMGFSVLVEAVNIIANRRKQRKSGALTGRQAAAATVPNSIAATAIAGGGELHTPAPAAVMATGGTEPPRPRPSSTPASRAQSRPKSAPRKK